MPEFEGGGKMCELLCHHGSFKGQVPQKRTQAFCYSKTQALIAAPCTSRCAVPDAWVSFRVY